MNNPFFKLANAIGAYILYVFIEAIRPIEEQVSSNKIQDAIEYLIKTSIPLDKMFIWFREIFDSDKQRSNAHANESGFDFKRTYHALKTVYPSINEMEKGFSERMQRFLVYQTYYTIAHVKCDHDWMETNVHKIGRVYECKNCHNPSLSPKIANPGKMDQEGTDAYIYDIMNDIAERIKLCMRINNC